MSYGNVFPLERVGERCKILQNWLIPVRLHWASRIAQLVKNPPAMQETPVRFLGQEDLLEKG